MNTRVAETVSMIETIVNEQFTVTERPEQCTAAVVQTLDLWGSQKYLQMNGHP